MKEAKILNCPCEDIGYLLWRITKFWQRAKYRIIDEFGLTVPQMEILGAIYQMSKCDKDITQILLSQETGIDPMTTSTILRNLQKKNLITRTESKTDTRARNVDITEVGQQLFLKAIGKVECIQEELFAKIDREALVKQLQILLNQLENYKRLND